jgi:hypothetical protein
MFCLLGDPACSCAKVRHSRTSFSLKTFVKYVNICGFSWTCLDIGLGGKFSLSFFRESFREIHFSFSRKILYEKTKFLISRKCRGKNPSTANFIYMSFSRKNLGKSFRENLIVVVLEPLRFGSNKIRFSAAPALLKWPYKSSDHRN